MPITTTTTTTATTTVTKQNQTTYGNWSQTYNPSGNYVTNISILPYIRPQQLIFAAKGMLVNTQLNGFFDDVYVTPWIRKPNEIELTGVSGKFTSGDSIGYLSGPNYIETGKVIDSYAYANTSNVRLYVIGDIGSSTYTTGTLVNGLFNTSGVYQTYTASGTFVSQKHYSGQCIADGISNTSTNLVKLSTLASSNSTFYVGLPFNICGGQGKSSTTLSSNVTVSSYNVTTKTVTLSSNVTFANNSLYSIGRISTNEIGSVSGVLYISAGTFKTGQRAFKLDNRVILSVGGNYIYNPGSETTSSESTFYASGIQKESQEVNYSASIHNAKNTIKKTQTQDVTSTRTTVQTVVTPDPVNYAYSGWSDWGGGNGGI